jgi:anti-sigma regulatory factor (Ser/Thr protein kinase)
VKQMTLTVPAQQEWALVLRTALNGVGVLANLSVDMIADLRTACDEAFDLLTHQPRSAESITLECQLQNNVLTMCLNAQRAHDFQTCVPSDSEVANLIIGTLVTDVHLYSDSCGIYSVSMSLSAAAS